MSYLEKMEELNIKKELIDKEISFLRKYGNWDRLDNCKLSIVNHGKYSSLNITIDNFEMIEEIIDHYKPSEIIKNNLQSTAGEYENLSPFIIKCDCFPARMIYSTNSWYRIINLSYIVNEELTINIDIPIILCKEFIKMNIKEDPRSGTNFCKEEAQAEIIISYDKYRISSEEFGTSCSFASKHYYYGKKESDILEIKRLLGI